jgi:hypothetical protein
MYRPHRPLVSSSAKAPRAIPHVLLKPEYSGWLAGILKPNKPSKRYLSNSTGQAKQLIEILSLDSAQWTLCEVNLSEASRKSLQGDGPSQTLSTIMCLIQAHVVHIDMISRHEMCFKLTLGTIQNLTKFYDEVSIHQIKASMKTCRRQVKEARSKGLRQDFVKAVNDFVFFTHISALGSLASDGAGSLYGHSVDTVRKAIDGLFVPIVPPSRKKSIPLSQGLDGPTSQESLPVFGPLEPVEVLGIPYLSDVGQRQDYTTHLDDGFPPGAAEFTSHLFIRNEQNCPPLHTDGFSHYSELPYPSEICGNIRYLTGFD